MVGIGGSATITPARQGERRDSVKKQPDKLDKNVNETKKGGRPRRDSESSVKQPVQQKPIFKEPVKEAKYIEFLLHEKYNLYEDQKKQSDRESALKTLEEVALRWALELSKQKG